MEIKSIITGLELGADIDAIKNSFENFKTIERRLELIADVYDIKIFDDFAHHPTAVATALDSIKLSYPRKKAFAILNPINFQGQSYFLNEFVAALKKTDRVIITKSFLGREANKSIKPVNLNMLCNKIDINQSEYIESSDKICSKIFSDAKSGDIIIAFGAVEFYLRYSISTYKYSLNQAISMVKAKKTLTYDMVLRNHSK